jgi:uncharacterized protein (TIGR02271 family)
VSDTSGRNVKVDRARLREGMEVYSAEGQRLGRIERLDADEVTVDGRRYAFALIDRIQGDRVTLARQAGTTTDRVVETEGQMRVPVREERLTTDTRQVERGDVQVTKTVTSEQQTVPVELTREEVHVEQTDTADRPASEAEAAGAFQEGTIRVPVRGEEAVARKETVVTGEVVIDKTRTTETEQVTDTVRREHVEVDENYDKARAAYQQQLAKRPGAPKPEEAEPYFRTGYAAALDKRYAGKTFEEVEPELRQATGVADESAWERLKREVREGFTGARER